MSLLRLLTAGKSLVGLKDSANRYRPAAKRALPTFPSKSNPFRTTAKPETQAAQAGGTTAEPEQAEGSSVSKASLKERLAALLRAKPRADAAKAPVQAELSLDDVKVVRNDLADSDLEVVSTGGATPGTAQPAKGWAKIAERFAPTAK